MTDSQAYNYCNEFYYTKGAKFFNKFCPHHEFPILQLSNEHVSNADGILNGHARFNSIDATDAINHFSPTMIVIFIGSCMHVSNWMFGGSDEALKMHLNMVLIHELAHVVRYYTSGKGLFKRVPDADLQTKIRYFNQRFDSDEEYECDKMAYDYLKILYSDNREKLLLLEYISYTITDRSHTYNEMVAYDNIRQIHSSGQDPFSTELRYKVFNDFLENSDSFTHGKNGDLFNSRGRFKLRPIKPS